MAQRGDGQQSCDRVHVYSLVHLLHFERENDGADLTAGIVANHEAHVVGARRQVEFFFQADAVAGKLFQRFRLGISSYRMKEFPRIFDLFIERNGPDFEIKGRVLRRIKGHAA